METINEWKNLTLESFKNMAREVGTTLPDIVGALLVLLMGWLVIRLVLVILKRVFRLVKIDSFTEKINAAELFGKYDINFKISAILLGFVKWILWLGFFVVAADIMDWKIISTEIGNLMRYLPKLFSAILLFGLGLYIASFIRKTIQGLFEQFEQSGSKLVGNLVFYVIMVFISITALNQAGIDTTLITSNVTVILGAMLLALALGFGLGSKEVISGLLRTYYARKNLLPGDRIKIGDLQGEVESIDNISLILKTTKGRVIIPIKEVIDNRVELQ